MAELISVIARLAAAIDDLPATLMELDLDALGLPPHARTPEYWRDHDRRARWPQRLLADHLQHRLPPLYQLLVALGAIDENDPARAISLDALADALGDPAATLRGLAGWGSPALDGDWITNTVADLAGSAGLPGPDRDAAGRGGRAGGRRGAGDALCGAAGRVRPRRRRPGRGRGAGAARRATGWRSRT